MAITEVSIRQENKREVGIRRIPAYTPNTPVDPAIPRKVGTPTRVQFLTHVYCGQTAEWMKTPLGREVDLGPGHIVLDWIPALRERGTAALVFSAHVCCGYGRPSQLLLSSSIQVCFSSTLASQLDLRRSIPGFPKFTFTFDRKRNTFPPVTLNFNI